MLHNLDIASTYGWNMAMMWSQPCCVSTDISCVRSSLGIVEIPFTFTQMIRMLGRCRLTALISHNIVNYTRGPNTTNMLRFLEIHQRLYIYYHVSLFKCSVFSVSAFTLLLWWLYSYTNLSQEFLTFYLNFDIIILVEVKYKSQLVEQLAIILIHLSPCIT